MNRPRRPRRVAITDTNFKYTTEKTGYLSIHPMDLTPISWDADYASEFQGALRLVNGNCASTGINLPQGAKVVSLLTVFTAVADTATNPSVALVRINWSTDALVYLVNRGFTDTSDTRKSVSTPIPASLSIIKNAAYSYSFAICLGAGDWFEGVRITYKYSKAGDEEGRRLALASSPIVRGVELIWPKRLSPATLHGQPTLS